MLCVMMSSSNPSSMDADQVAHDLRSPLAALELMLSCLDEVPEEKRTILRAAVSRIREITDALSGSRG